MQTYKAFQFDKQFWQQLIDLIKPFWLDRHNLKTYFLFVMGIILTLVTLVANVALNDFNKLFYDALQQFNSSEIQHALVYFGLIVAVILFAYGYQFYISQVLMIRWRTHLTSRYFSLWTKHQNTDVKNQSLDNVDQRLCEDLASFPELSLDLFFTMLGALLSFMVFSVILWRISSHYYLHMGQYVLPIPGYLCWGTILYGIIGFQITLWLGRRLAKLDYEQQKVNADLRFAMVRMRQQDKIKQKSVHQLLRKIINNFLEVTMIKKKLIFFNSGYSTVAFVMGLLMAVPLYLHHDIQLGGLMQVSGASASVIGAFTILVKSYQKIAEWRAVVFRIVEVDQLFQQNPVILSASEGSSNKLHGVY